MSKRVQGQRGEDGAGLDPEVRVLSIRSRHEFEAFVQIHSEAYVKAGKYRGRQPKIDAKSVSHIAEYIGERRIKLELYITTLLCWGL